MVELKVGGASVPVEEAHALVYRYLNTPSEHWAYPAYDGYRGAPSEEVAEQDLFAPTLLNAGINRLSSYYGFLDVLPAVNERLRYVPREAAIAQADDAQLGAVADLFGILDEPGIRGVRLTKFSKVLHRKRPEIIPLFDRYIRACYQEAPGAPVPPVNGRSWRDFALEWLPVVRNDLREQSATWLELAALTPPEGPTITPLRVLDIVGWSLGRRIGASGPATTEMDAD